MKDKCICNLCRGKELSLIYHLEDFNIKRCNECGLVFRDVMLDENDTKELYSETYFISEQKFFFINNPELKKKIFRDKLCRLEEIVCSIQSRNDWKKKEERERGGGKEGFIRYWLRNWNVFISRTRIRLECARS